VSINDQLLAALTVYGLPVLFGVCMISSLGVPLPGTFLLVAAGAFVQLGDMDLWSVMSLGVLGAILGDQMGYFIGRWGGRRLAGRMSQWLGGEKRLAQVEGTVKKWGGFGIFFSRWLVIQLGPWINLTSGFTSFSYPRFLLWDLAGEGVWVILYVMVGEIFSGQAQALMEMLGNLAWAFVGLVAAIIFGWLLFRTYRTNHK
jgi:membrane-associated protein